MDSAVLGHESRGLQARIRQGFRVRVFRMTICLAHISALQYWRAVRCGFRPKPRAARIAPPAKTNRSEIASLLDEPWTSEVFSPFQQPIHIAISARNGKRNRPGVVCHDICDACFAGKAMRIDEKTFVLSPEALFLQLARSLSVEALALVACELCGLYSMKPDGSDFVSAKPVSSVASLLSFASSAVSYPGNAKAKKALGFSVDKSASPAESELVALLCAKQTLGGYGLPLPMMNYRVDVVGEGRKCTPRKFFVLDLFWQSARLDVEYDSDAFHASAAGISSDAERRNALQAMGFSVITVTNGQVSSADLLDDAACAIARALGIRFRHSCKTWNKRRFAFRRNLRAARKLVQHGAPACSAAISGPPGAKCQKGASLHEE